MTSWRTTLAGWAQFAALAVLFVVHILQKKPITQDEIMALVQSLVIAVGFHVAKDHQA